MQFEYQIKIVITHFRFPEAQFHFYIVCLQPLSENVSLIMKMTKNCQKLNCMYKQITLIRIFV